MKRKLNLISVSRVLKRLRERVLKPYASITAIMLSAVFLCGCSTLSYSGEDFNRSNSQAATTKEAFYFSTYTKQINGANVSVGISKSQVQEILVIYLGIDNTQGTAAIPVSYSDVAVWVGDSPADLITSANYAAVYKGEQNDLILSAQAMAPTITNMANVANNYYSTGQNPILRDQNTSSASLRQLDDILGGIREHSITSTSMVKPTEKKYYYIFVKDDNNYPIKIQYKGLEWVYSNKVK